MAAAVNLFIRHCVLERECISLFKGYRLALEQKGRHPWWLMGDGDVSTDLLHQLDSHGMPCLRPQFKTHVWWFKRVYFVLCCAVLCCAAIIIYLLMLVCRVHMRTMRSVVMRWLESG